MGSASSGERGAVLTVACCVTAARKSVLSVLKFKGVKEKDEIRAAIHVEATLH